MYVATMCTIRPIIIQKTDGEVYSVGPHSNNSNINHTFTNTNPSCLRPFWCLSGSANCILLPPKCFFHLWHVYTFGQSNLLKTRWLIFISETLVHSEQQIVKLSVLSQAAWSGYSPVQRTQCSQPIKVSKELHYNYRCGSLKLVTYLVHFN